MLGTIINSILFYTRYVSVFLCRLYLCLSDWKTSSLGVGLPGRLSRSVGMVLFVVSSLLRHRTSSIIKIKDRLA